MEGEEEGVRVGRMGWGWGWAWGLGCLELAFGCLGGCIGCEYCWGRSEVLVEAWTVGSLFDIIK